MYDEERKLLLEEESRVILSSLLKEMKKKIELSSKMVSGEENKYSTSVSFKSNELDNELLEMLKNGVSLLDAEVVAHFISDDDTQKSGRTVVSMTLDKLPIKKEEDIDKPKKEKSIKI